jgi:hypothetical protein
MHLATLEDSFSSAHGSIGTEYKKKTYEINIVDEEDEDSVSECS